MHNNQEMTEGCWQEVKVTSEVMLDNIVSGDCKALGHIKKEITEGEGQVEGDREAKGKSISRKS